MRALLHDMDDEELRSFAEMHQGIANDDQTELYIFTCLLLFTRTDSTDYLEQAIQRMKEMTAPIGRPDRARLLHILNAMSVQLRLFRLGLKSTIASQQTGLHLQVNPRNNPADKNGYIAKLTESIERTDREINTAQEDDQASLLNNLAALLFSRFELTDSTNDLNRAINVATMAVNTTFDDMHYLVSRRFNLIRILMRRFERTNSIHDLNRIIRIADVVINTTAAGDGYLPPTRHVLITHLIQRFNRTDSIDDCHRIIEVIALSVDADPQDYPVRASLVHWLGIRFERTGSKDDLNRAFQIIEATVEDASKDHGRADMWSNIAPRLEARYERTNSVDELNHLSDTLTKAVEANIRRNVHRLRPLNALMLCLYKKAERTGVVDKLDFAIEAAMTAVEATEQGIPYRNDTLHVLAISLRLRFDRTNSTDDLNLAIDYAIMAVGASKDDYQHPNLRQLALSNLTICLWKRFDRIGTIDDLDHAIDVASQAVDSASQDNSSRATCLESLAFCLDSRFMLIRSIQDINSAIDHFKMAIEMTPPDSFDRFRILNALALCLNSRFEYNGSMEDFNEAVTHLTTVVNTHPSSDANHAIYLANLGVLHGKHFDETDSMTDINRAVELITLALDTTPQQVPERATRLNNLGIFLHKRSMRTDSIDDADRALSLHQEGWRCHSGLPNIRMHSAKNGAMILASQSRWPESNKLFQEALNFLPIMTSWSLKNTDKENRLAEVTGLASNAAAAALNAGEAASFALGLLELGRGVISGLLLDMRGDVSEVEQRYPALAQEFKSLRDELDSFGEDKLPQTISNSIESWESRAKRRQKADQRLSEIITRIRAQPGFHGFLLPPSPEELMAAANPNPIVVVNGSQFRYDAFLIKHDEIKVLPLPDLNKKELEERILQLRSCRLSSSSDMASVLEWLWNAAAGPILDALGFKDAISDEENWPRMWWIPTGLLSQLPFHAAGFHVKGSGETVLDRVMSSYAISVKALIRGRRLHSQASTGPLSNHALLVAMGETPNLGVNAVLPFAVEEAEVVRSLCPSLDLQPIIPACHKDQVLKLVQTCKIFHFAGHGQMNSKEPSKSLLLLKDWKTNPLTVGDLRDHKIEKNPPFLGFLSACSTGANETTKLSDEGIHLINAFQLAGFRHVVGTLWEVSDKLCVDVSRRLYETMRDQGMTDDAVCRGLHRATRELRDRTTTKSRRTRDAKLVSLQTTAQGFMASHWVPYVHFGV
ncbi:hypothetical protein CDD81_4182 [Ophiocordyceps australis]|uniref:CHAT domain-containing protein n=1 Tax=Ophiocordyceps australis TaxID=1399860 RepID=A0A2C5XNP8_9HYPO|nr:hypothetical protein CDD81_4182 [Ophiocordyceps australis]